MSDRFGWITPSHALTAADPDYEFWQEAAEIEEWIADGAPPLIDEPPAAVPAPVEAVRVPPVALALSEAAAAEVLDMSASSFRRNVRPLLKYVQTGRLVRYPVAELERYVNDNARRAL